MSEDGLLDGDVLLTIEPEVKDHDPDIPGKDEPNAALILVFDVENYLVLGHTGAYFFWTCDYDGEVYGRHPYDVIGICDIPEDAGYYVFEKGYPRIWTDWETGISEWDGIDGDVRVAHLNDFKHFDVDIPIDGVEHDTD